MPVNREPPNYAISKNYLKNLAEIAKYLDLGNEFISSLFYFGKNYTIVIEIILFTMSI